MAATLIALGDSLLDRHNDRVEVTVDGPKGLTPLLGHLDLIGRFEGVTVRPALS
jgi:hypothetical protein